MDQTDREILALLATNGRRSNVEIARELGISEGTVRKRIDRLLEDQVLTIRGVVEPELAGYGIRALFFLTAELAGLDDALALIRDMPEVLAISRVTGEYDLIVEAVFASDADLATFLAHRLSQVPGIVSAKTAHVLEMVKHRYDWTVPDSETPRVMVVDDDPDFVEVTRMVLERAGFSVRSTASGREALIAMAANPPDLVILDIMMDGVLDGWDAGWRIRSNPQLSDLPILVVSSITATDYLGMVPTDSDNLIDNFLSKPVAPDRLVMEVKRLLRRVGTPPRG
jgi:Lrp/AsnC family transcriptional regulator for asnA, asnC and gidA